MAGGITSVEADVSELIRGIAEIRELSFRPFFASLAEDMEGEAYDNYQTSGHGKWQKLAKSTLRKKARAGKSNKALIWSGTSMNSPTIDSGEDFASVQGNTPQIVFHVSDAPRHKIPKRDPYKMEDSFYDEAIERLGTFIASGGREGL